MTKVYSLIITSKEDHIDIIKKILSSVDPKTVKLEIGADVKWST